MNINVKFFASLREQIGTGELQVSAADIEALLNALKARLSDTGIEYLLSANVRLAVNQDLVEGNWRETALVFTDGDEVAFLPPVTGG